jgi:glycosyltransferase involved in cell wall biosynthesis
MKICIVHNEYRVLGGEDLVVRATVDLLRRNGQQVRCFTCNSSDIESRRFGKLKAFFSGIYSSSSRKRWKRFLSEERPDIVHVHNLYPLISPSILCECGESRIPVVMTVHNFRLICPNGLLFSNGKPCDKCLGGREYWCVLKNCEKDIFKSTGYALRNYVARKKRWFMDNVTLFIALTEFQRRIFVSEGFPSERIDVIPNMTDLSPLDASPPMGDYVAYVGRVSPEKGIPTLLEAARLCPDIPFRFAGAVDSMLGDVSKAPPNCTFLGKLSKTELISFYASARFLVLPSICYEGFPLSLIEAMSQSKAVICSRIGGLPEIVEEGVTGRLFEPGNSMELAEIIRYLWSRTDIVRAMGRAGRDKAQRDYSPEKYTNRLMSVYEKATKVISSTSIN